MKNRYKLFQVERNPIGALPGMASIMLSPNPISSVLSDEIARVGRASAFGVECDTFAWFEVSSLINLILREDDPQFNIDLAMSQLGHLRGEVEIDFFAVIDARITRRNSSLVPILRTQGFRPMSSGGLLSQQGMGGCLYQPPHNGKVPVFAAPPLPKLVGNAGDQGFDELVDLWFRQLRETLEKLKDHFGSIDLAFEKGDVPVPTWFMKWCAGQGINIKFEGREGPDASLEQSTSGLFNLQRVDPFLKLMEASDHFTDQGAVGRPPKVYLPEGINVKFERSEGYDASLEQAKSGFFHLQCVDPFLKLKEPSDHFTDQSVVSRPPKVCLSDDIPKEDLEEMPAVSSCNLPNGLADMPQEFILRMGFDPNAPLRRFQVRFLCRNSQINDFQAYAFVMAWGGQRMSHFRSSANDNHLLDLVKQLRTSKLSRSEDFERCRAACAGIKGLGISFFSKLLYFLRPKTDAYILDQWIAKSLSVLFNPSPVRMAPWGGPHPMTTATEYDACCEAIEQLGLKLGGWSGDQVEQLLFDRPGGKWRTYVTNCLAGATDEELAEFETTEASPCDDTHSCLPCTLAEIVAAMHREAAESESKIPAFADPSVQHSCQRTSPCRVYCGINGDGWQWYYHINKASVRVGAFIPRSSKDCLGNLGKRGEEIDSKFWEGITISDHGDTCSISICVSGGCNAPLSDFPETADRAVSAMENLNRRISQILT
jgi:hypothetical protein